MSSATSMPDCFVHPDPGRHVALEWVAATSIPSELELLRVALAALDALRRVVVPLSAELAVVWSDDRRLPRPEPPPIPFWLLSAATSPEGVALDPMYVDPRRDRAVRLDAATLESWVVRALEQPSADAGTSATWAELLWRSTCARWPDDGGTGSVVPVRTESGEVRVPVHVAEGERWICGPVGRTKPPVTLGVVNEGGRLALTIQVHWSCWTEAHRPGRRALDDAVGRIREQGWEQVSTDLP